MDLKIGSNPLNLIGRRRVLGTLTTAAVSLFAMTGTSAAWGRKSTSVNVNRLPDEWTQRQGRNLNSYANYIDTLKLKKISTHDVIAAHAKKRGNIWNTLPPRRWWKRMGRTLQVVDRMAVSMNTPVRDIVSAYRSPQYNARCSGAKKRSWHQANVAVDVKFGVSPRYAASIARRVRKRGYFKGGVGSYSTFTHIDTRGSNADW